MVFLLVEWVEPPAQHKFAHAILMKLDFQVVCLNPVIIKWLDYFTMLSRICVTAVEALGEIFQVSLGDGNWSHVCVRKAPSWPISSWYLSVTVSIDAQHSWHWEFRNTFRYLSYLWCSRHRNVCLNCSFKCYGPQISTGFYHLPKQGRRRKEILVGLSTWLPSGTWRVNIAPCTKAQTCGELFVFRVQ
jgi:hypothetical protein